LAHGQTVSEVMARFHRFTQLVTIAHLNRINCDYLTQLLDPSADLNSSSVVFSNVVVDLYLKPIINEWLPLFLHKPLEHF